MAKSIADINKELSKLMELEHSLFLNEFQSFRTEYKEDPRKGVVKLIEKGSKRIIAYETELERVEFMLTYEKNFKDKGYIGGIDEAGRGPLAGPVVAACVILDPSDPILYVNDSKKLSEGKREELYQEIINRSIAYGIGVISEGEIDQINILQATYKAMRAALDQMEIKPDFLLNDAVIIPGVTLGQEKIIKGDAKSLSIAAASILAKVTRDRIMVAYDELFPEYGFANHKGYGSATHIEMIKSIGPCPIHRRSFIKGFI